MKATTHTLLSNQSPEVKLEHLNESCSFSISVFGRKHFQCEFDVFEQINLFWASLPMEKQTEIFSIYKNIELGFHNIYSRNELVNYLKQHVAALIDAHGLTTVTDWIRFNNVVMIPSTFDTDYNHSIDNNTSREKTYTRHDYVQLVSLSLIMRCLVPIWGEYITTIRQEVGTLHKEFYAFQLLELSSIQHSIPMEKLKVYIEHIVGDDKYNPNNTMNGIVSDDYGYWLLGMVCIRRLCVGDIRGLDPKAHLIALIYKFIIQKIRSSDNNYENAIKEKTFDDRSPEGENKISTLERYKIKTNISLGEIVELEYSARDVSALVAKLAYQVTQESLASSLKTSQALMAERILDPQMTLLRWVFKTVISPRGLMYLPRPMIVNALGALEAVLWARGHKYLAVLATSHSVVSDKEMIVSPVDSKMRIPKELTDEISKIYPHTRIMNNKKTGVKEVNLTLQSIDTLTDNLTMFSWKPTASDEKLNEVFGNNSRRLPIKPDIKLYLTKLVIEIGSRSWL
jgi:hypothetical protein